MEISELSKIYQNRYDNYLIDISEKLENHLKDNFRGIERIDRITARAKSPERFIDKSQKEENGKLKYDDPLHQIQDQVGARIITFYRNDVEQISQIVTEYYREIEIIKHIPDSESEFGYIGKHFILVIPDDIIDENLNRNEIPKFFELQIKTLFQHAWSEANHDLGYKSNYELTSEEKRKIAFTAAQSWGADQIFSELSEYVRKHT